MPERPPVTPRLAAATAALAIAGGCAFAPTRWVEARTAPPGAAAREGAWAPQPQPMPALPAPEGTKAP